MAAFAGFSQPIPANTLAGIGHNCGPTLNPVLRPFWEARVAPDGYPVRNRVLYGGRASSKSWDAAGFAVFLAQSFKVKFLCARQFQNKIEESVYSLIVTQIERFGLRDQFRILDNKIIHKRTGSEFLFYGLWRHISEIKSLEGVDICWLEEAHALTENQWKILEPTVRKAGSQFWVIFNPALSTDFAWRRFVASPPRGTIVRAINYVENPFLSQTMLDVIEAAKAEDIDEYEHIYLGIPRDDDDNAVIKRSWIMAAIDAHKALGIEPTGQKRLGFDVADGGKDKCALIYAHGQLVSWGEQWKAREDELLKSSTRAWNAAVERDADLIYDSIGVGAQVGAKVIELNRADEYGRPSTTSVRHVAFNAGAGVDRPDAMYGGTKKTNSDMFANLKAQTWWHVADMFRATFNAVRKAEVDRKDGLPVVVKDPSSLVFIASDMPNLTQLIDELSTPRRDFDNSGKVKVESKKDLARTNRPGGPVASPNLADAFVMAFMPGRQAMKINASVLERARMMGRRA